MISNRLEAFAAGKVEKNKPKPAPEWIPPTIEDFAWGIRIQAFDQTLTNTGYVQVEVGEWDPPINGPGVRIWDTQTIRPKPDPFLRSFAEKFDRQYQLAAELTKIIECTDPVVFEMPAVHGFETESSLLAGSAIYDVAMENQGKRPTMVSKNHVGSVLCNDPKAKKPEIKKALMRYLPEVAGNEHTRDALAIGLTYLYDLKKARDEY
jgi:Holliday junction resolvasome RuvABC endonuclease subunit